MKNSPNIKTYGYKRLKGSIKCFITLGILFGYQGCNILFAWGFEPHKRINQQACLILPEPLFGFYKSHISYMVQHATDPDMRRYIDSNEAGKHYIDMEHYGNNIDSLPFAYNLALSKFGEDHLHKEGNLPWNIIRHVYLLKKAFSEGNTGFILKISADLGHYVADAHVPLHTTENYNGQLTGQTGIHGLWETQIPKLFMDTLLVPIPNFQFEENWKTWIWETIEESHNLVPMVLSQEKETKLNISEAERYTFELKNKQPEKTFSRKYLEYYHKALKGSVEMRYIASAQLTAKLIYTAWILAGEPPLNSKVKTEYTQTTQSSNPKISSEEIDCNH